MNAHLICLARTLSMFDRRAASQKSVQREFYEALQAIDASDLREDCDIVLGVTDVRFDHVVKALAGHAKAREAFSPAAVDMMTGEPECADLTREEVEEVASRMPLADLVFLSLCDGFGVLEDHVIEIITEVRAQRTS